MDCLEPSLLGLELEPIYLSKEEIEYEFQIRNLAITNEKRKDNATLREIIKQESQGRSTWPKEFYGDPMEEMSICLENLQLIGKNIKEAIEKRETNTLIAISGRLKHYEDRIKRLNTVNSSAASDLHEILVRLVKQINEKSKEKQIQIEPTLVRKSIGRGEIIQRQRENIARNRAEKEKEAVVASDEIRDYFSSGSDRLSGLFNSQMTAQQISGMDSLTNKNNPQKKDNPVTVINDTYDLRYRDPTTYEELLRRDISRLQINYERRNQLPPPRNNDWHPFQPHRENPALNANIPYNIDQNIDRGIPNQEQRRQPQRQVEDNDRYNRIPLRKWPISFSGDSNGPSLNDFLTRVEIFARSERTTEHELHVQIFHLLKGRAQDWYLGNHQRFQNWNELVYGLRQQYLPVNYDYLVREEIQSRFQAKNESFSSFMTDMNILFQRVYPPVDENYRLFIVRRNMLPEYSFQLSTVVIHSIDHLTMLCKQMDEAKLIDARRRFGPVNSQLMEPTCFSSARGREIKPVSEVNFSNPEYKLNIQYDRNTRSPNFQGSNQNSPSRYDNFYRRYDDSRRSPDFAQNRQSYSPHNSNRRYVNFNEGRRSPYQEQTRQYYPSYDSGRRSPNFNEGRRSPSHNQADRRVHFSNVSESQNHNRGRGACWNCDGTGHRHYDCTKQTRRTFCEYCGHKNVTTRNCPKNHPFIRNSRRTPSEDRSGNDRAED